MANVCFIRVDRIGDLVLTLPCEAVWKFHRAEDSIHWLISENLRFVTDSARDVGPVFFAGNPRQGIMTEFAAALKLAADLKAKNFDEALLFHVPWWVALAVWWARVPVRVGPASQWFSWFFFNRRLRQKRSEALKHESQYNLDLVGFALGKSLSSSELKSLSLREPGSPILNHWKEFFKKQHLQPDKLVIIHPGMAGSARNWPAPKYFELGQKLISLGYSIVVTGSSADKIFVDKTGLLNLPGTCDLVEKTPGSAILAVLSLARAVVAPSTGVAHLAASLGKKVVGLYSPVKVQAPRRWAPVGRDVNVLVPKVDCPGVKSCLGPACGLYDCMNQIDVDSVLSCVIQKS